ncbi:hypothetical protein RRG08_045429 [Elysia crispata]|uniref:Uncharacterized protein n=1 Tax=Elysia crispata TaxID=231223 RepID=A0AAE1AXD7_9GAST|nr:hypothetical protein RRG08_045429 [Elysia crispata]
MSTSRRENVSCSNIVQLFATFPPGVNPIDFCIVRLEEPALDYPAATEIFSKHDKRGDFSPGFGSGGCHIRI